MTKLCVAASGTGTLLEAILAYKLQVDLVLVDRPCRALNIAKEAGIPYQLLQRSFGKRFDESARLEYTQSVISEFKAHNIGLVAMAGYMTIFDPIIFQHYPYRILNTHPSLLPSFKGDNAVADALKYRVKITGCTIHIATAELDAGPILEQVAVRVKIGDSVETLHERIKKAERKAYPELIYTYLSRILNRQV